MASLIPTIVSIVITMLMFSGFITWANIGVANVLTAAAASQQIIVNNAAAKYVQDNGAIVAQIATATTPATITVAMLTNTNYLPTGFSSTNVFGQQWQVQVLQPSSGVLEAAVLSIGGRAITDTRQLVQIAAQSGAQGGFVPYAGQNGDATMSANFAYGAYGAWKVPLTGFTNPGSGHLFSLLAVTNAQTNSSYLYRVQVPNHPELNNMQTDLGLTDVGGTKHNINGVATADADKFQTTGGGQFTSDQGGSLELGGNDGQAGSGTPYVDFHLGGQGIQNFNARIINDSDGHLTLAAANGQGSLSVQGTLQPGAVATAGTSCPTNGQAAANIDGSGQWLSCQYHQWLPIGGHKLWYGYYSVSNGSAVPAPTCPQGGTPAILTVPQSFTVDPTAIVNYSTNGAGGWTVSVVDGSGSPIGGTGVAQTFCAYQ